MSAQEYLVKAVEYDLSGRKLEALKLYQSGIAALLQICKGKVMISSLLFLHQNDFQRFSPKITNRGKTTR